MSHLHLPDGVLPLWLWAGGWLVAAALLAAGLRAQRRRSVQRVAFEGALTALMLAAMAVEIPLGPLEYHLTLAGPIGVLLGTAGAFQAAFIASAVLSFVGHGGFTVIGLNALNLGAVAAIAGLVYRRLLRRWRPGPALGVATAVAQLAGGLGWALLMYAGIRTHAEATGTPGPHSALVPSLAVLLMVVGATTEGLVALGFGRFLDRVRPDLVGAQARVPARASESGPGEHPPDAEGRHVRTG